MLLIDYPLRNGTRVGHRETCMLRCSGQVAQLVERIAEVEAANDALEQRLSVLSPTGAAEGLGSIEGALPAAASAEAHLKRARTLRQIVTEAPVEILTL